MDQIASIERLEKQRKDYTKKVLQDDFLTVNDSILQKKMIDREVNESKRRNETYNYFPIVGSELVE